MAVCVCVCVCSVCTQSSDMGAGDGLSCLSVPQLSGDMFVCERGSAGLRVCVCLYPTVICDR